MEAELSHGPCCQGVPGGAAIFVYDASDLLEQAERRVFPPEHRSCHPGNAFRNRRWIINQHDNRRQRLQHLGFDRKQFSVAARGSIVENRNVNRMLDQGVNAVDVASGNNLVPKGLKHEFSDGQYLFAIADAEKNLLLASQT
jgi:hypothetical protein